MRTIEQEYAETQPRSRGLYERADGARKSDVDDHAYRDGWRGHGALISGDPAPPWSRLPILLV